MRSCNQCGKSIGNEKTVCEPCQTKFDSKKLEPPKLLFEKQKDRRVVPEPEGRLKSFLRSDLFALLVVCLPTMVGAASGLIFSGPIGGLAGFMVGLLVGLFLLFHSVLS